MTHHPTTLEIMRNDALSIFQAAIRAVDPETAVRRHLQYADGFLTLGDERFALENFENIFVVGAGKATAPMARAVEDLLGERIADGAIVVKEGHGLPLGRIRVFEGRHPLPDERGVIGTEAVMTLVDKASERDLVICLISGGGSALLVSPIDGISLDDKQEATRALLACGADIHEINTVRKHLSRVKGGQLARLAAPATVVSLILSDVVGDDLDVIASGPTVPDSSNFKAAQDILNAYAIWDQVAPSVRDSIWRGIAGEIAETPKVGAPFFERCCLSLVGTNLQALQAAAQEAQRRGYGSLILSSSVEGEAREAAKVYAAIAKEVQGSGNPIHPPACLLCGGETTVTLKGDGKGGRNQEFALATALALDGIPNIVFLGAGTDGTDGPTDAAGALADGETLERARCKGISAADFLRRNDAYHFFQKLDDLIISGPTRTNVMDMYLFLIHEKQKG